MSKTIFRSPITRKCAIRRFLADATQGIWDQMRVGGEHLNQQEGVRAAGCGGCGEWASMGS